MAVVSSTHPRERARKRGRRAPKPPGPRGVTKYKRTGRWVANLWQPTEDRGPGKRRGYQVHLGPFATQDLATLAYNRAVYRQRGAAARLNAPRDWRSDTWWREHASLRWPDFLAALRAWGQSTFAGRPPPVREAPPPLPLVVETTQAVDADASPPHLWSSPFSPLLPTPFGGDEDEHPDIVFFDEGLLQGGGDGGVLPGRGSADEEADVLDVFWF